ncbi:MAG: hypothetical protein ABIB71_03960, partial [Candidatus Woesearchaeota archaeon]
MDTVKFGIFSPPELNSAYTQKSVGIYKPFDAARDVSGIEANKDETESATPAAKKEHENVSDYKLINVQEAYGLMKEGRKVSFLDENLNKIEVEGINASAYDGRIYDVTVPNHVILVKRDGLVTWSGNSLERNFTSLDPGKYQFKAYVVDMAGNMNETGWYTVTVNGVPTHGTPTISSSSGNNLTYDNLTAYPQSASDANGDTIKFIYDWRINGSSLAVLNLPFEANTSSSTSTKDFSNYNNDGNVGGAAFSSSSGYDGFGAYEFGGDEDNITIADSASLNQKNEITIEAWVKPNQKRVVNISSSIYYHTCAVMEDGTAMCWGYNVYGQLGDGTTTNRNLPVKVKGLINATMISTGYYSTCALLLNNTVMCWGYGGEGSLGDGTWATSYTPVKANIIDAAKIDITSYDHTCALLLNGTVMCWGYNGYGQVGDGTVINNNTPVKAAGIEDAVDIGVGVHHSCAVLQNGTAMCWGYNPHGNLGDGTTTNNYTGVVVSGLVNATRISLGTYHSCAVLQNDTAMCWGYNGYGQIGDGTYTNRYTPVKVSG